MKSIEELYEFIPELIDQVKYDNNKVLIFNDKAKTIIKEIAEFARKTGIWENVKEQRERFWEDTKDSTPEQVYAYMLDRIVNAPTSIHRNSSIILIIPRLDEMLNG